MVATRHGGSVATKYLGLTTTQSVLVGVAILVLAEIAMLVFGWFDARNGIIRAQQALVNEQDPFRVEMLARVASIERELMALRQWATRTGA